MGEGHRTQQSSTFQERRNGAWYSAKHRKWCQLLTASSHTFTVIISSSCQPCINTQAWAAEYWYKLGLPKQKLNVGLALYGRSFTLSDPYNNGVGAPAKGKGNAGNYTREAGFLSYFEVHICSFSFLFNEVSNSMVLFKHQREAMDATFKCMNIQKEVYIICIRFARKSPREPKNTTFLSRSRPTLRTLTSGWGTMMQTAWQ